MAYYLPPYIAQYHGYDSNSGSFYYCCQYHCFNGIGLPWTWSYATNPKLGELLQQGKSNLDSPWIATSVVTAIVLVLVMVTFIGEAIRAAFDPKRLTRYQ